MKIGKKPNNMFGDPQCGIRTHNSTLRRRVLYPVALTEVNVPNRDWKVLFGQVLIIDEECVHDNDVLFEQLDLIRFYL